MLARIETAQATRGNADRQSSRELATDAARACLEQAACSPDGVGLIIYSGTLRDEHVQELIA